MALGAQMRKALFICSRNRLRSPTAEQVFSGRAGWEVASAGLSPDAEEVVTVEWLDWADLILVMEKRHQKLLNERFGRSLKGKQLVCLRIPDQYDFMDPELVSLLTERAGPYLKEGDSYGS